MSDFQEKPKLYPFVEPNVTRQELIKILVKGLERSLTEQETRFIHWLGDCDYETRGVIVDLFKEMGKKIEFYKENP